MDEIIIPKKILFVTRYNKCRGPAAEEILKFLSPDTTCFSVGTDPEIVGDSMDEAMITHLQNMGIQARSRQCMYIDWILDDIHHFEVHNLDNEFIQHPFDIDYDYPETISQLASYIHDIIFENQGDIDDILRSNQD